MLTRQQKWDQRFMDMAKLVASWSKDPSTKCGAVIVRPDNTVASVGYNGFPRGMIDRPSYYDDRVLKYARILHAEVNAMLHTREVLYGCTLYTYPGPTCERCAVMAIQAGIKRVVGQRAPLQLRLRWDKSYYQAIEFYREAGVKFSYWPE